MRRVSWLTILTLVVLIAGAAALALLIPKPRTNAEPKPDANAQPLRLGVIPERDIFQQMQRYKALSAHLGKRLGRPVELMIAKSYDAVLDDFREHKIDGAFLGSLVTLLACDDLGAEVILKAEQPDGTSTYSGVLFVPESSPIKSVSDLRGKRVATVRMTMAGHLFPKSELRKAGVMEGEGSPEFVWAGTHDQVIHEVMEGRVDAGAVKNLRLDAFRRRHGQFSVRVLAQSEPAPDSALVLRKGIDPELRKALERTLLEMVQQPEGRTALQEFGIKKFVPCSIEEYAALRRMMKQLGAERLSKAL